MTWEHIAERLDAARRPWWFPLAAAVALVAAVALSALFPWGFA